MAEYDRADVVIAGAGVAGLAAGQLLARAGLRVICIEPEPLPRTRVGESLDWSAPRLLTELGLPRHDLIAAGAGTRRREIRATTPSGELMIGRPPGWLSHRPLRFEASTLHLDRERFDELLYQAAAAAGVEFVWAHVRDLEFEKDRIVGCRTGDGRRFDSDWFIDATGRRRLVARTRRLADTTWGTPRMSLWTRHSAPMPFEGTMLYLDDASDDFDWPGKSPLLRIARASVWCSP